MGKSAKFTKKPLNKKLSKNKNNLLNYTTSQQQVNKNNTHTPPSHSTKRRNRIIELSNEAQDAKSKGKSVLNDKDYLKLYEK